MAEGLVDPSTKTGDDVAPSSSSICQRRISFHLEKKPYSPISSSGGSFRLQTLNPSSSTAPLPHADVAQEAAAKAAVSRSDARLDPEISFRITFRRIGAGLANLGNTCFLNSVLQCLTYTEPFAAYLQSGKHKSSCRTAGFCALCALQNHVMTALQSTGKILSPSHLVKNLRCVSRNFRNSRQEDAHEYMVNLLESMHKCCLPSGVPTESPSAYDKSLVHKIFGGRLRSQVQCTQCNFSSNKIDPFLDLSLEIVKTDSLRKALMHFTHVEQLDGGEKRYQCQRCKQKVRAFKQLTIHKAPNVLTIHLKRFGSNIPGQKIDKKVEFEPTLDLKPFVSDHNETDLKYTLYGVLVHAGWSTHSGHYYCFVRTSSGMWHSLDDNRVVQVSEKAVLAQKAYMLFYVRDRKGSANIACKDNASTYAQGSKMKPQPTCHMTGVVPNGTVKSSIAENSAVTPKSSENMPKAIPVLESNGFVRNKASCSQTNGIVQSNGLLQATQSMEHTKLPSDNLTKEIPVSVSSNGHHLQNKNSSIVNASHIDNVVLGHERSQTKNGKSQSAEGCNMKVGSSILPVQLSTTGSLNSGSGSSNNHLKHVNGNVINGISQINDAIFKMDTVSIRAHMKQKVVSQSVHGNGSMEKEPVETELVETQIAGRGGNIIIEEKPGENSKELSNFEKSSVDSHTKRKPKKFAKALSKGPCFGRKQLFLKSLAVHKSKMNKDLKKSIRKMIRDGKMTGDKVKEVIAVDDQGRSVSEATRVVGRVSSRLSKKRARTTSKAGDDVEGVQDVKYSNGDANDTAIEMNDKISSKIATSEHPTNSTKPAGTQCEARKEENGPAEQIALSRLLSFNQTIVPKWDGVDETDNLGHEFPRSSSIGYIPDEWDEEYDRGRRKKIKQSRTISGGPNPFQEYANEKIQKNMKGKRNQIRSANQPFRI